MEQFQILSDLNRKIHEIKIYKLYEVEKINNSDIIELFALDVNLTKEHFLYPNCDVFFVLTEDNQVCGCLFFFEFDNHIELHGTGHPKITLECWKQGMETVKEYRKIKNKKIIVNLYNKLLYNKLKLLGFKHCYTVMEYE